MELSQAAEEITKECAYIPGIEINFTENGPEIYWENLRVTCNAKTLKKALRALRILSDMDARFE